MWLACWRNPVCRAPPGKMNSQTKLVDGRWKTPSDAGSIPAISTKTPSKQRAFSSYSASILLFPLGIFHPEAMSAYGHHISMIAIGFCQSISQSPHKRIDGLLRYSFWLYV